MPDEIIDADEVPDTDKPAKDLGSRPPDDPGVSSDEEEEAPRKFRLF
jgi:uncharacterized membrane-anchored protein